MEESGAAGPSDYLLHDVEHAHEGRRGPASRSLLLLHGILGHGGNWRGFARQLTEARPDYVVSAADLRAHGRSQGAPPPFTVEAAAHDLAVLERRRGRPFTAVAAHSFGTKVATLFCARGAEPPQQLWLIDADPGGRPDRLTEEARQREMAFRILGALQELPRTFDDRRQFRAAWQPYGLPDPIVAWLGTSLERGGDRLHMPLEPSKLRPLLEDFLALDTWDAIERLACTIDVRFVLGGASDTVSAEARERLAQLEADGRVRVEVIEGAGHWVHVDRPKELLERFVADLPGRPPSAGADA